MRRTIISVIVSIVLVATAGPVWAHEHHHHHHHHTKRHHHHGSHSSSSSDNDSGDSGTAQSGDAGSTGSSDDLPVSPTDGTTDNKSDSKSKSKSDDSTPVTTDDGSADSATNGADAKIPTGTQQSITAELTGFSFQDNTPPGSSTISMPVLHKVAGGTGTFADPITTAVPGHAPNVETPKGTRLYVAKLKRYFIVEDSGATKEGTRHFDLWVGGQGFSKSQSDKCESSYTGKLPIILNPPAGEPVTPGQLTGANGCNV